MVYVSKDGTVQEKAPFSLFGFFYGIINFFTLFFRTMFEPNYSKYGDKYKVDYRPPGGGPPRPPTRRFGGFGPSSSGPAPPPAGGCGGCGCG